MSEGFALLYQLTSCHCQKVVLWSKMNQSTKSGLTILESLIVIFASILLLWVVLPVLLVRYGYKEAGIMVATEASKTIENADEALLQSRIKDVEKPTVIKSILPPKEAPSLPARTMEFK